MSAKEHIIMKILSLVTPEEINHLINSSPSTNRVPLTNMLEEYIQAEFKSDAGDEGAKILPFKSQYNKDQQVQYHQPAFLRAGVQTEKLINSYCHDFVDVDEVQEAYTKKDTSSFIMLEKKRFEKSQHRLKEKEVLDSYLKNSQVDIDVESKNKDDLAKAGMVGVLVNKKQF